MGGGAWGEDLGAIGRRREGDDGDVYVAGGLNKRTGMGLNIFQYNTYGLLNLSAGLFNIMLGIVVYLNNPKSSLQRVFFLFTIVSSLWVTSYGFMSVLREDQTASQFLKIAFFGVPFIPATLYQLSRRIRGFNRLTGLEITAYAVSIPFIIFMAAARPYICDIRTVSWGRFNFFKDTTFAWTYFLLLMLHFTIFISIAYWNFVAAVRNARGLIEKRQNKILLIAFSIVYCGMIDFAVTKGFPVYPPGYIVLTLLSSIIAYTIVRYQLWEINVAIKRASLIALCYTFLICFSIPAIYPFARKALENTLSDHVWLFLAFSALFGLVFSTGPLIYSFLERHTFWLKKHITTGLTHELKSPIGAIRGALDLSIDRLQSPNTDLKIVGEYLQMIDRNTTRLESFVKDLLHVAKGQDGVFEVERHPLNLCDIVHEEIKTFEPAASRKNNSFHITQPNELIIEGEKEKISQIFSNLLSNAVKFTANGKIEISIGRHSNTAICSIKDSGCGVPPADLERIFERFYQGRNVNKGAGIGLTIAKAWVEAHGGKIWAESEGEGKGTTVTFTLPI